MTMSRWIRGLLVAATLAVPIAASAAAQDARPAATKPAPAKRAAYQLTEREIPTLRDAIGESAFHVTQNEKIRKRLDAVFRAVADGVAISSRYSFYRLFSEQITGRPGPDDTELIDGRFIHVRACGPAGCSSRAAFIADLDTGHLVMIATSLDGLWMVHKACINEELKTAAYKRFGPMHFYKVRMTECRR